MSLQGSDTDHNYNSNNKGCQRTKRAAIVCTQLPSTMYTLSILTILALRQLSETKTVEALGDIFKLCLTHETDDIQQSAVGTEVVQVGLRFFSGRKMLFYSKAEGGTQALKKIMAQQAWSVTVVNSLLVLPLEEGQVKKPKEPNVVILLNDEEEWSGILAVFVRLRVLGPLSRVLLVVPSNHPESLLLEAWNTLTQLNVTTLTYFSHQLAYHTLFPYEKPPRVQELNLSDNLFPHKVPKDFKGYPLRVAADTMEPYVFQTADGRRDGVEVRILNIITDYYNLGLKYITVSRNDRSRRNYQNGMANGFFRVISRHIADILTAGIRKNLPRYELSETLPSHTEDRVLWAYPRPTPKHDWSSIYRTFSISTWILIGSLIFFIPATSTLLENYQSKKQNIKSQFLRNLLYIWGYILEVPSPYSPETLLRRAFMTITFMYTINLACSYKSTLVTLLTTEKPGKEYQAAIEAVEDGLHVYLQHGPSANDQEMDMWNAILLPDRFQVSRNYTLNFEAVANGSAIAYAVEYPSKYLATKHFLDDHGKSLLAYMKIPQSTFSVCFFMAPGHPLEERFYRKTLQLTEGGIIAAIRESIMEEAMLKSVLAQGKSTSKQSLPRALALENLQAIFVIHVAALIVSTVLFFAELVPHLWSRRRAGKSRVTTQKVDVRGQYRRPRLAFVMTRTTRKTNVITVCK